MAENMRCARCNREFPDQEQLDRHNREQHGDEPDQPNQGGQDRSYPPRPGNERTGG